MNREIKFEYGFQSTNGIIKKVYHLHEIPNIAKICDVWNELPLIYVRQFTGLQDKNKKDIREGDTTKCGKAILFYDGIFAPHYDYGKAEMIEDIGTDWWSKIEVIGNIYENNTIEED